MEESKKRKETSWTKNGLLILAIGFAVSTIGVVSSRYASTLGPLSLILGFISGIAGLASLAGGLMVVLGRQSFGPKHSKNAIYALVLFIISIVAGVVGGIIFSVSVVLNFVGNGPNPSNLTANSITSSFYILLITIMITSILSGQATVLLTYALQKQTVRILLWMAYISSVTLAIVNSIIIFQGIAGAINEAFANGGYNPAPLQALQFQENPFQLLAIIPTLVFAVGFYLAWSRIVKGELPESSILAQIQPRRI